MRNERLQNSAILAAIIAAGLLSRTFHTGWRVFDKDLGDALYAAMMYVLLLLAFPRRSNLFALVWASLIMLGLELFQLTGIPAALYADSQNLAVRTLARLMGTHFGLSDLVAYAAGLAAIHLIKQRC
ncbi:MAG: DUF2809 domain-containing protein [Acidobacteria bacterium]|nr:DUF2809 domain-containing protein [Acidobacteriota bacterium]